MRPVCCLLYFILHTSILCIYFKAFGASLQIVSTFLRQVQIWIHPIRFLEFTYSICWTLLYRATFMWPWMPSLWLFSGLSCSISSVNLLLIGNLNWVWINGWINNSDWQNVYLILNVWLAESVIQLDLIGSGRLIDLNA